MKKKRSTKSNSRLIDVVLGIVCVSGIAVFSGLFIKDWNRSTSLENEEPVAIVVHKKNTTQRRFADDEVWQKVKVADLVYGGDRIRTDAESEATIIYNDGRTSIDMYENTMVTIRRLEEGVGFDFTKGSVNVVASEASEDKPVVVTSGSKILSLSGTSSAVFESSKKGEATVAVTSGSVQIQEKPVEEKKTAVQKAVEGARKTVSKVLPLSEEKNDNDTPVEDDISKKTDSESNEIKSDVTSTTTQNGVQTEKLQRRDVDLKERAAAVMTNVKQSKIVHAGEVVLLDDLRKVEEVETVGIEKAQEREETKAVVQKVRTATVKAEEKQKEIKQALTQALGEERAAEVSESIQKTREVIQNNEPAKVKEVEKRNDKNVTEQKKKVDAVTDAETRKAEKKRIEEQKKAEEKRIREEALKKAEEEHKAAEKKIAEEKAEKERIKKAEAARKEAERIKKEKAAAEKKAKEEAARKAEEVRKEKERVEAERKALEEAAKKAEAERIEQERLAKEAAEKALKERLAQEEAQRKEAERIEKERKTAEKKARQEMQRKAEEERKERERLLKEAEEKAEQERLAIEEAERQRIEAEKKAREEYIRKAEEARKARELEAQKEYERLEAERKVREEAERLEAERKAREEAERLEAERKAREEAERLEAERKAREEAERLEAEQKVQKEESKTRTTKTVREEKPAAKVETKNESRQVSETSEPQRNIHETTETKTSSGKKKVTETTEKTSEKEKASEKSEEEKKKELERIAKENAEKAEADRKAKLEAAKQATADKFRKKISSLKKPVPDFVLDENTFDSDESAIQFSWTKIENAKKYHFAVYKEGNEKQPVVDKTLKGNAYTLKDRELEQLENGKYIWEVYGINIIDGKEVHSRVASSSFAVSMEDAGLVELDISELLH